jgi:hypothetical protein
LKTALSVSQKMVDDYFGNSDLLTWTKKISRLVSMTEGAIQNAFGESAISSKLQRAAQAEEFDAKDADAQTADQPGEDTSFVCPISLDAEKDVVLLITEGEPLVQDVKKQILDDLLTCPLNIFKYDELVLKISERLDHPIGLSALKKDLNKVLQNSPFTRKPILGGLVLGGCLDHVKASNWTLARMITGGKVGGNFELWFTVVWLVAKSKEYLKDIVPNMEEHLKWRLSNCKTFASITGLPEFCTTKITFKSALWFVLASPFLDIPLGANPLRAHITHLGPLKELFALTNYSLPEGADRYHARIDGLLSLLGISKRVSKEIFKTQIQALYTKAMSIRNSSFGGDVLQFEKWVPWIIFTGAPTDQQVAIARGELYDLFNGLTVDEIVGLAEFASPKLSAKNINLPLNWNAAKVSPVEDTWGYGSEDFKAPVVPICPETCRPYSTVDGKKSWTELASEYYGVKNFLSTHNAFGRFVAKYVRYPTKPEFLLFLFNRYVIHGQHQGLPVQTVKLIDQTFLDFEPIIKKTRPAQFIARFKQSVTIKARKAAEMVQGKLEDDDWEVKVKSKQ